MFVLILELSPRSEKEMAIQILVKCPYSADQGSIW